MVKCSNCGGEVMVNGVGRKPLNMTVINICDALQDSSTITAAAIKLNCSRGYVYKELARHGLTPKEVMQK